MIVTVVSRASEFQRTTAGTREEPAILVSQFAVDPGHANSRAQRDASERAPAAFRVDRVRGSRHRGIDQRKVGPVAFANESARGDVEEAGRRMRGLLHHGFDRESPGVHVLE